MNNKLDFDFAEAAANEVTKIYWMKLPFHAFTSMVIQQIHGWR